MREVHPSQLTMTPAHRHLLSRVGILVIATVALDLAASIAIYLFERDAHGTGIHTLADALFWTSTQLTTVSSQLPNPASTPRGSSTWRSRPTGSPS